MVLTDTVITDIVIVGGGLSGLTLAHLLSTKGINVLLLEKALQQKTTIHLGESLPPSSTPLLERLELNALLDAGPHCKTQGYLSAWGSGHLVRQDFSHYPSGYGWKLNKQALTHDLSTSLHQKTLSYRRINQITYTADTVKLDVQLLSKKTIAIRSRFIVDATGRSRWLSKKAGMKENAGSTQDLLAFVTNIKTSGSTPLTDAKCSVLVESFPLGWGTVSLFPEQKHYALTLFTTKAIATAYQLHKIKSWQTILSETKYLKDYLPCHTCAVRGLKAGSSILQTLCNPYWLAIGDAAMTFDPLSSHGITNALYSVEKAAAALINRLEGQEADFDYNNLMQSIFSTYYQECRRIYQLEQRWPGSVFWKTMQ